jgi:hypothetical protein
MLDAGLGFTYRVLVVGVHVPDYALAGGGFFWRCHVEYKFVNL